MKEFEFYLDQKHTIWYRNTFTIEAKYLEEAKAKVIEMCNTNTGDLPSEDWDLIHDTAEYISPEENNGEATDELYTHDGDLVWKNV